MNAPHPIRRTRLEQVMDYCRRVFAEQGHAPSYTMIRDELGLTDRATVRQYVKQAEARGLVTLGDYAGGRGPRRGQRIRLGNASEVQTVRLKKGREL